MKRAQNFLWGVATSAFQFEGGFDGPGEPQTNWSAAQSSGEAAQTGRGVDFWNLYAQDFARCEAMGLNAFRLGIEWSRVEPVFQNEPGHRPEADLAALDHYAEILMECRSRGLEPVITLHHFTHPEWLGSDPWFDSKTPGLFADYVRRTVRHLNEVMVARGHDPLRFFITINEPTMLVLNTYLGNQFPTAAPLGFRSVVKAYNGLLSAHILAYNALHDLYTEAGWPTPAVTLNNYCSDVYWSDKFLLDLLAVRERGVPRSAVPEHILQKATEFQQAFRSANLPLQKNLPYYFGALAKALSRRIGQSWLEREVFAPLLAVLAASPRAVVFDYLAIDYYDPFAAHAFRLPVFWDHEFKNKSFRSWVINTITSKWWEWRVLPRGLHFFCQYYTRDFGGRSLLIAENGMALRRRPDNRHTHRRDGISRSEFLRLHVHEVMRIVNEGIPLMGYLHWSLVDNYEWGSFTPRFGLFAIDWKQGPARLPEDHLGDRPSETYAALIRETSRSETRNNALSLEN